MREIKFRAWNSVDKAHVQWSTIGAVGGLNVLIKNKPLSQGGGGYRWNLY